MPLGLPTTVDRQLLRPADFLMWGRFSTCGGFVTRLGGSGILVGRPIKNRPQVKNLPHNVSIPTCEKAGLPRNRRSNLRPIGHVYRNLQRTRRPHNSLGRFHFLRRAMCQEDELVRLKRSLVLHDAVLRDA